MNLDMDRILASKRAHRSRLTALPVAEKLRLLDALRARTVALRRAGTAASANADPRLRASTPEPAANATDPR